MIVKQERMEAFLKEYEALCRKYHLSIGACGCCGSPWVTDETDSGIALDVRHLRAHAGLEAGPAAGGQV
jgi:hypothetical protein